MTRMTLADFESRYRADPDPWGYTSSAYEHEKYVATLEACGAGPFAHAPQPGGSIRCVQLDARSSLRAADDDRCRAHGGDSVPRSALARPSRPRAPRLDPRCRPSRSFRSRGRVGDPRLPNAAELAATVVMLESRISLGSSPGRGAWRRRARAAARCTTGSRASAPAGVA